MKQCHENLQGNCQHVERAPDGSWIIPLGTHIFSGVTVSNKPFLAGRVIEPQNDEELEVPDDIKQEGDELASDLVDIVGGYTDLDKESFVALVQALTIYIVDRDHKILQHGIKVRGDQK